MISASLQSSKGDFSPNIDGNNNAVTYGIKSKIANEVKTIQLIIDTLTTEARKESTLAQVPPGVIDPENKIWHRFSEYGQRLTNLYADLAERYASQYAEVIKENQIPANDTKMLASYLRRKSVAILEENNQNPITALEKLTQYVENQFVSDGVHEFNYDSGAVSYYLYNQLVACNVFPNPYDNQ